MAYQPRRLVPLSAAAEHLSLPQKWLREEASLGRLPHIRVAHQLFFDLDALEDSLLARIDRGQGFPEPNPQPDLAEGMDPEDDRG